MQGEDTDDYVRFTAKAPAGRPFTGRAVLPPTTSLANMTATQKRQYLANQPVTITSEYAEIIYFLRNGNLYRRVLLIAPELQPSITPTFNNVGYFLDATGVLSISNPFSPGGLGGTQVSWQGVNDLSARPAGTGPSVNVISTLPAGAQAGSQAQQTVTLNTLGDLTNRENRYAYSRFANDYLNLTTSAGPGPDGIADDFNGDNVPDYYPTLYPTVIPPAGGGIGSTGPIDVNSNALQLVYEPDYNNANNNGFVRGFLGLAGFPFVFSGAYSKNQVLTGGNGLPPVDAVGWIHAPSAYALVPAAGGCNAYTFDSQPLTYLQNMNQNPVDLGDNLPTLFLVDSLPIQGGRLTAQALKQTWWGFPTWRETLSPSWTDPTVQVNVGPTSLAAAGAAIPQQPPGLIPLTPAEVSQGFINNYNPGNNPSRALLPSTSVSAGWRTNADTFSDGWGDNPQGTTYFFGSGSPLWANQSWEDDLIMTGVRSFDVKAFDNALSGYGDLGWGDDVRLFGTYSAMLGYTGNNTAAYLYATPSFTLWPPVIPGGSSVPTLSTMAHEGRMPPLREDNRLDYQNPNPTYGTANYTAQYPANFPNYDSNIGDDNTGVVRLRRVWDSWSTEYSNAPATGVGATGFPVGPPFTPPIYPSYPPPYPAPLRGIQIQIRVTDPSNQRIKSLTIRQDFTDKL